MKYTKRRYDPRENKEVIKYDKNTKYSDWSDKTLRTYKDKDKIEYEIDIISTFANETKVDVEISLEAKCKYKIISTFKVKKNKNTDEQKIKGMLSMLAEAK